MKLALYVLVLMLCTIITGTSTNYEPYEINIYGNTNYSSSSSESLKTSVHVEYTVSLYEPSHKKWGIFIAGKLNPLYDHLGKELKMDVFTVLGIDF